MELYKCKQCSRVSNCVSSANQHYLHSHHHPVLSSANCHDEREHDDNNDSSSSLHYTPIYFPKLKIVLSRPVSEDTRKVQPNYEVGKAKAIEIKLDDMTVSEIERIIQLSFSNNKANTRNIVKLRDSKNLPSEKDKNDDDGSCNETSEDEQVSTKTSKSDDSDSEYVLSSIEAETDVETDDDDDGEEMEDSDSECTDDEGSKVETESCTNNVPNISSKMEEVSSDNFRESAIYSCYFCSKHFNRNHLQRHMRKKHYSKKKKGYPCTTSNKIYHTEMGVMKHPCAKWSKPKTINQDHQNHKKKKKKCKSCGKIFAHFHSLKVHLWKIHKMKGKIQKWAYNCATCHASLQDESSYKVHLSLHRPENPYRCNVGGCKCVFRQRDDFTRHIRTHKRKLKLYECNHCSKRIKRLSSLKRHVDLVHPGEPLSYTIVQQLENEAPVVMVVLNSTSSDLDASEASDSEREEISEDKDTRDGSQVNESKSTSDKIEGGGSCSQTYKCHFCKLPFPRMDLPRHMKKNHYSKKDGGYICTDCGKLYHTPTGFIGHTCQNLPKDAPQDRQIPPNKKPQKRKKCARCGKVFAHLASLNTHLRKIHKTKVSVPADTNKFPFTCPICQSGKQSENTYKEHLKLHLPGNPYRCKVEDCWKVFRNRYYLDLHMGLHNGERTCFKCSHCSKVLKRLANLKTHIDELHPGKSLQFTTVHIKRCLPKEEPMDEGEGGRVEIGCIDLDENMSNQEPNNPMSKEEEECTQSVKDVVAKLYPELLKKARKRRPRMFDKEPLKCTDCDYEATSHGFLMRHVRKEHPNLLSQAEARDEDSCGPVLCGSCGFRAETTEELKAHVNDEHIKGEGNFPCKLCSRRFSTEANKKRHFLRVHESKRKDTSDMMKYPCPVLSCRKVISGKTGLRKHTATVHSIKESGPPVDCPLCGKQYSSVVNLKKHHSNVHEQFGRHKCRSCDAVLATSSTLKYHIRAIHGEDGVKIDFL